MAGIPPIDGKDGWVAVAPVLYAQPAFRTRSWQATFQGTRLNEVFCAIWERFTASGRALPVFGVNGYQTDPQDAQSALEIGLHAPSLTDKNEIVRQIHSAIFQLAGYFVDRDINPVGEAQFLAHGLKHSGHLFPDDLIVAEKVLSDLQWLEVPVIDYDESFYFHAPLLKDQPYANWALPLTVSGLKVEGYKLNEGSSALYGTIRLKGKDTFTFRRAVRLEYDDSPDVPCGYVYARCGGAWELDKNGQAETTAIHGLPAPGEGSPALGDIEQDLPVASYPYHQPPVFPANQGGDGAQGRASDPFISPATNNTRQRVIDFSITKEPDARYFLISKPNLPLCGASAADAVYSAKVDWITLNNYVLPQFPDTPFEVTDFLVSGSNKIQLRFENVYGWSPLYLIETLILTDEIKAPAVLKYKGKCYEALGNCGDDYYYYDYYEGASSEKCWFRHYLKERAVFSVNGALNAGFQCLPYVDPLAGQKNNTVDVWTKAGYHDYSFKASFTAREGRNYSVWLSYLSVNEVVKDFKVAEGVVASRVTELDLVLPINLAHTMAVRVELDSPLPDELSTLEAGLPSWGIKKGQVWHGMFPPVAQGTVLFIGPGGVTAVTAGEQKGIVDSSDIETIYPTCYGCQAPPPKAQGVCDSLPMPDKIPPYVGPSSEPDYLGINIVLVEYKGKARYYSLATGIVNVVTFQGGHLLRASVPRTDHEGMDVSFTMVDPSWKMQPSGSGFYERYPSDTEGFTTSSLLDLFELNNAYTSAEPAAFSLSIPLSPTDFPDLVKEVSIPIEEGSGVVCVQSFSEEQGVFVSYGELSASIRIITEL